MDVTVARMSKANYKALSAFIGSLRGRFGTFTMKLPTESTPSGSSLGSVTLNGSASSGATSLALTAVGATLVAGDKFTIAGQTKVYMLTEGGSGSGTYDITPPLRANASGGAAVTFEDFLFTLRLTDDTQQMSVRPPELYTYSFSCREAL